MCVLSASTKYKCLAYYVVDVYPLVSEYYDVLIGHLENRYRGRTYLGDYSEECLLCVF